MDIKLITAILVAKAIKIACRVFNHAGTSLPGKVAIKIDSQILAKLSRGVTVIMVTGTNGKTTTTGMISEVFNKAGKRHFVNKSGANLISGIVSAFVDSVNLLRNRSYLLAVLEVDEAALDKLADLLQPDILVVTNFFRDQLDRYGELYSVVSKVKSAISKSPKAKLVLNADDSLCASLGKHVPNETVFFGVEPSAGVHAEEQQVSAASYCIFCREKYQFSYRVLGHLGGFKCPGCGFERPQPQVRCTLIQELDAVSSTATFEMGGKSYFTNIAVPGLFNVYNALAATSCCYMIGLPPEEIVNTFERFEGCFGRMETIHTGDHKKIVLILAKNPTGFNQVLDYLSMEKKSIHISFVINDRVQDGTDVSWIWDVDFEKLNKIKNRLGIVYTSGIRAEDMALRLKYAGIPEERIHIQKNYRRLFQDGFETAETADIFYIVATYTAMMDLRRILRKRYGLKEIWQ